MNYKTTETSLLSIKLSTADAFQMLVFKNH